MIDVEKILSELTLEEKCILLTGGGALRTGEVPRLGVPYLELSDGPHGIRRLIGHPFYPQECNIAGGDTALPTASAVGASWSEEVAYEAGVTIAKDCMEEGIQVLLAPGTNMKRTPHCGRNFEYFSEDPYHSGMLTAAFINGVQSKGIGTSLKHYAVNNQEINRGTINAEVDERTLREYYLKPFEIVLKHSEPTSIMCAYNKLNGIWCSENKYLLTEVLKEAWGYKGMVVSDWRAVHNISRAIKAGLDLQMPKNEDIEKHIRWGLENHIIDIDDVNRAVRSVLKFVKRILEMRQEKEPYDRDKQHDAGYKAACECITLLRNEHNILPFTKEKYKKIAVLGTCAMKPVFLGGGSSKVTVEDSSVDKPYEMMKKVCGGIEVDYYSLEEAFATGKATRSIREIGAKYDAVVYFLGDQLGMDVEAEGFDRDNLSFPNYINSAIRVGIDSNPNFVLVLQTGGAVIPKRWEHIPGLVQMWYSGEAGGRAIADVLFGKVNPSGKLSETFALKERTDLDYPGDETKVIYKEQSALGYRYYDKHSDEVWFPFGHGLSYTEYAYSDLNVSDKIFNSDKFSIDVSFKLKNVGKMAGKEVVQLYIAPLDNIVDRPIKELKKFAKVALAADEEKTVQFKLDESDFAYFNTCLHEWHVESGRYQILIGSSSTKMELSETISIKYLWDYTIDAKDSSMIL